MQDDNTLKHTPGPWRVVAYNLDEYVTGNYWRIEAGEGFFEGSLLNDRIKAERGCGFSAVGYMAEADAHLIAAAPELLEACRVALAGYRGLTGDDDGPEYFERTLGDVMNALSAAIAKAEGRS